MNRFGYGIILMVMLAGISLPGAVFAQGAADQGQIVNDIVFNGLQNISAAAQQHLHGILKSKIGQPYNKDTVAADGLAIRDEGWFRSVHSETEMFQGGVRIIFTVVENPVIAGVEFVGNTRLTSMQLLTLISTKTGTVLNRNLISADAQAIETAYTLKGYAQTEVVDYQLTDDNKLVFTIFEPKIGEIRIEGNSKTRDYVIRRQLTFHAGDIL